VGLRRILTVADVLLGCVDENELMDHLLPALLKAVPADSVVWGATMRDRTTWNAEPAATLSADRLAALDAHAESDPLLLHVRRGPGGAVRRSDLQNDADYRQLPLFQGFYADLGARRQLAVSVRPEGDRRVVLLFNRTGPDFTHQDLAVADALRPRIAAALKRFGPPSARREKVSPREADVLDLLCRGLTDRQIATRLGISPRTVDKHLEHAYVKLGVRCRVQAAARWRA
jgi:DNA-binding CsgD family transcriptional regulator